MHWMQPKPQQKNCKPRLNRPSMRQVKGKRMNNQRRNKPIKLFLIFIIPLLISSAAALSPWEPTQQTNPTATPERVISTADTQTMETEPSLVPSATENPTLTLTAIPPTATPFPDWAMTSKDTDGLLFAGIFILLIIIIGTLTAMAQKPHSPQE